MSPALLHLQRSPYFKSSEFVDMFCQQNRGRWRGAHLRDGI